MVETIKQVFMKSRYSLVGTVFGLALMTAGAVAFVQPNTSSVAAATNCDKVNIVYCGLSGSSGSAYIKSFQNDYNSGASNGHNDLKTVYRWAGATDASVKAMNTSNTKLGTMYKNGDIKVGGKVVGHTAWVSARFTEGKGFTKVSDGVWARKTTTSLAESSAQVIVHYNNNGQADFAAMTGCGNAVKFTPTPAPKPQPKPQPKAALSCVSLSATQVGSTDEFSFSAKASASNTTITKYVFSYGDGNSDTVSTNAKIASSNHTYTKDGVMMHATVTVYSKDFPKGQTAKACSKCVTTPKTPKECKPGVPVGSPECTPCKYNSQLPSSSPECKCKPPVTPPTPPTTPTPPTPPTTTPPTVLPNTGAGNVIGFFGATTIAGGMLHRFLLRRKVVA